MNRETTLSKNIRMAVNRTGRARLLDNEVGFASKEKVTFGLGEGSSDLVGCLRGGRLFVLEVKLPGARTAPDRLKKQLAWQRAVRLWGGFACFVESIEQAMFALTRAEAGFSE